MTISKLKDLIGLKVVFRAGYDNDENEKEVIGVVSSAYLDDFHFNEKWNEPIYTSICFQPINDKKVYKEMSEEEYISIFEDTYILEDILQIIN